MSKKSLPKIVILSYLALVVANLIWAAAGPVIKLTIQYIPPFTFLFLRFMLVCLLILPYAVIEVSKNKVDPRDYLKIFLLGVFSQSCIIFIVFGLKYTTAIDTALIGSLAVILSMGAGHYFFNEKMHPGVKLGLTVAIFGTFVVIIEPLLTKGASLNGTSAGLRVWGNFLVFLSNIAFLMYIIWSKISFGQSTNIIKKSLNFLHIKPMNSRYPASLLTSVSFYVGMFTMLPFAVLENLNYFGPTNYDLMALDPKAVAGIVYMALLSSITAYFMFEWALNSVSVGDTAILGYISTIFALPFAYWILAEVPTFYGLLGAVIIGTGVAIAELSAHFHKKKKIFLREL